MQALAAALDAASDLKAAGAAYQSKHAGLNIHPAAMVWLQSPMRGLEEAIKAQPSLAGRVPDMNFIFTGARPHKSKEEKLKALGPFRRCADQAASARAHQERARKRKPDIAPSTRGKYAFQSAGDCLGSLFLPGTILLVEPGEEVRPLGPGNDYFRSI